MSSKASLREAFQITDFRFQSLKFEICNLKSRRDRLQIQRARREELFNFHFS